MSTGNCGMVPQVLTDFQILENLFAWPSGDSCHLVAHPGSLLVTSPSQAALQDAGPWKETETVLSLAGLLVSSDTPQITHSYYELIESWCGFQHNLKLPIFLIRA